jgi:hypothetical protein
MSVLAPLMAMAVGQSLYAERERFKLAVLDNNTGTPFVTADQPIINLQHAHDGKPPENFELYYPLSPWKAMLLLEATSERDRFPLTDVSVNAYNVMMVKSSHEQIFSNSEEYLNGIKGPIALL